MNALTHLSENRIILNEVLLDDMNFQKSIVKNMSSNAIIIDASIDRQNVTELMIVGTKVMKMIVWVNYIAEDSLLLNMVHNIQQRYQTLIHSYLTFSIEGSKCPGTHPYAFMLDESD